MRAWHFVGAKLRDGELMPSKLRTYARTAIAKATGESAK